MKTKLLTALAWLFIGMAAIAGKPALADTHFVGKGGPAYCADWSFNDRNCPAYLERSEGKAAFGERSGKVMRIENAPAYCLDNDWGFNDPNCPAYLERTEGKAAYGEPAGKAMLRDATPTYCAENDWGFNDPNCPAFLIRN